MNLTGIELVEKGIVTNLLDEDGHLKQEFTDNVQQHGVDLNMVSVCFVDGEEECGVVPKNGKTQLAKRKYIPLSVDMHIKQFYWFLKPGVYDITFSQGCKVPADKMLLIRQRSSLLRNGTLLHSSVFDAGFETDRIGTVMFVHTPIKIYQNARVAQIYAHNSNVVENLYNGQWQGK